jgi:hypothetical protein
LREAGIRVGQHNYGADWLIDGPPKPSDPTPEEPQAWEAHRHVWREQLRWVERKLEEWCRLDHVPMWWEKDDGSLEPLDLRRRITGRLPKLCCPASFVEFPLLTERGNEQIKRQFAVWVSEPKLIDELAGHLPPSTGDRLPEAERSAAPTPTPRTAAPAPAPLRRGPKRGMIDRYSALDRALFSEIETLRRQGRSPTEAAQQLFSGGKIAGGGSARTKVRRLVAAYLREKDSDT